MDFDRLEIFLEVALSSSFSRAVESIVKLAPTFLLCFSLLLSTPLISSAAAAQKQSSRTTRPPAANKLTTLKVTGGTIYTDKEILAASGLIMGQIAADGDFKEAVQRLGNSGMFSDASYSFSSSASGVKLEIQLRDVDRSKLVPAHFENFAWLTDDELQAALQQRVPLFKQLLPLSGNLADHVSEALQAVLTDRKLPGRVSYLREAHDQTGGELAAARRGRS